MLEAIRHFRKDETGAVTVDWVVLTAAIVGLAIAVLAVISDGTLSYTDTLSQWLGEQEVTTY